MIYRDEIHQIKSKTARSVSTKSTQCNRMLMLFDVSDNLNNEEYSLLGYNAVYFKESLRCF
jgi:hypothetical protein